MRTLRRLIVFALCAVVLCFDAPPLLAQTTMVQAGHCVSIKVRLNGNPIEGPKLINLKSQQTEATLSLEGNCFSVPPAIIEEKTIDITFTVLGNKVSLWAIPTGFLAGMWQIDLADKKFGKNIVVPKHARAKDVCAVVFHIGEPETAIVQTGCRTLAGGPSFPLSTHKIYDLGGRVAHPFRSLFNK